MSRRGSARQRAFTPPRVRGRTRRVLLLLGDQLDPHLPLLTELDRQHDAVLMIEACGEATHVPSHRQRTALFLSAMRHHATGLANKGLRVEYVTLDAPDSTGTLAGELERSVARLKPDRVALLRPGEWRVRDALHAVLDAAGIALEEHEDPHFYLTPGEFSDWAAGRKTLVMEHFYRMMRRRFDVLMDDDGEPVGGRWNFDADNRATYRGSAPPAPPPHRSDAITREVLDLVDARFPDAPGASEAFAWAVTRRQALAALRDFIANRLPDFGMYQDAMRTGAPWMFHSLLSPALNLKLLNPREVVAAAIEAFAAGAAPLNSVEGFVRQIIGWREFIHGVYWHSGSAYAEGNALDQHGALPELYWTGQTELACLRECVGEVLEHGYGHHIQRLMVTGNFALIAGVHPRAISDWYLGMYVDAVDWVTLPNTLGMVMHADGGVVGTKPYAASGRYIDRMSDYCTDCRYDPGQRVGETACPFTTLYWDFLLRSARRFDRNPRMKMILRNATRLRRRHRDEIRQAARKLRNELGIEPAERGEATE
jgi:deoxyribodipyrimidine photolyase-related protein